MQKTHMTVYVCNENVRSVFITDDYGNEWIEGYRTIDNYQAGTVAVDTTYCMECGNDHEAPPDDAIELEFMVSECNNTEGPAILFNAKLTRIEAMEFANSILGKVQELRVLELKYQREQIQKLESE